MQIQFLNQQIKLDDSEIPYNEIEHVIESAREIANLEHEDFEFDSSVAIIFVNDEAILAINEDSRQIAEITDVLSYPMLEMQNGNLLEPLEDASFEPLLNEEGEEIGLNLHLGDIVINTSRAVEQAEEYGHSIKREICFLALHGFLHIIGFDHIDNNDKQMENLQDEILEQNGITRTMPDCDTVEDVSKDFKSGFVSIIGRPNAGKSTLLNCLMGSELAITSRKAQTTRNNIRTVLDDGTMQIVFVDTPGIHRSKSKLDRFMSDSAWRALAESDLVLLLVDPSKNKITEVEEVACKKAEENGIPIFLLLTKSDDLDKAQILPVIEKYSKFYSFAEIIPISALAGDNIDLLLSRIKHYLPEGPRYYEQEQYTDQTERSLSAEFIREQVLHYTHQEIPHKAAVVIDKFEERYDENNKRSLVVIHASIITDKDSHKGMIIGKSGQMLKRIGQSARIKIEQMLDCKVYLDLHVKVRKDWQNRESILQELGYAKGANGPSAKDIM